MVVQPWTSRRRRGAIGGGLQDLAVKAALRLAVWKGDVKTQISRIVKKGKGEGGGGHRGMQKFFASGRRKQG